MDLTQLVAQLTNLENNIPTQLKTGRKKESGAKASQEIRVLENTAKHQQTVRTLISCVETTSLDNNKYFLMQMNEFLLFIETQFTENTANELLELTLTVLQLKFTDNTWIQEMHSEGYTLAHLFAYHGKTAGLAFLEANGASTQQPNFIKIKPVALAVGHKNTSALTHLLQNHIDDTADTGEPNLLDLAILYKQNESVRILQEHGFTPSPRSINPITSILGVLLSGFAERIAQSVEGEKQYWLNKVGENHVNLIENEYTIYLKEISTVATNNDKTTPTFEKHILEGYCEKLNSPEINDLNIQMLIKNVCWKDQFGRTAMHYAAMNPDPTIYPTLHNMVYKKSQPQLLKIPQSQADNTGISPEQYHLAIHGSQQ